MSKSKYFGLPDETKIEVIAISKSGDVYKTEKTIAEFNQMKKKPGWKYQMFQLGFSQFSNVINK